MLWISHVTYGSHGGLQEVLQVALLLEVLYVLYISPTISEIFLVRHCAAKKANQFVVL